MNIGQAAQISGMPAKRIRYYEKIGLLEQVPRSDGGYRTYCPEDIHTLRFIRRARRLNFSIPQIRTLLALWHDHHRSSAQVKQIAQEHVIELQGKIAEMQSMVDTLSELAARCDGDHRPACPILVELQGGAS